MWLIVCAVFVICWYIIPLVVRLTLLAPVPCKSKRRLDGKVVLVTGANTGLGKETALDLAKRGAKVYMACRNMDKAEDAKMHILAECPEAQLHLIKLDLNSLQAVENCANEFLKAEDQLDIVVANAGFGSFAHKKTEDGIEWHLGCNHLGHFLLIRRLLPLLEKSSSPDSYSRIVVVSSLAHKISRDPLDYEGLQSGACKHRAYGLSKLANILFANHLARLLQEKGSHVTVNSLHPGVCLTEFSRYFLFGYQDILFPLVLTPLYIIGLTEKQGAQTQIYAAVDESLEGVTGKYFDACKIAETSKHVTVEEAEKLWDWSCEKASLPRTI